MCSSDLMSNQQANCFILPDGVGKMKQFACWFTHGVGNGSELRGIVHAARTPAEILESVERFFEGRVTAQQESDPDPVEVTRIVDRSAVTRIEDPAHGPSQHHGIEATLGT